MENKDYSLYSRISSYDEYIRKNIVNMIPNVYRDIRIHLLDELYNLEKNMFNATYNKGNIRIKYLTEIRVNISLMDMLLNNIRKIDKVNVRRVDVAISMLAYIKNVIYGWKYNEENKK
jgi:hypothetical protein